MKKLQAIALMVAVFGLLVAGSASAQLIGTDDIGLTGVGPGGGQSASDIGLGTANLRTVVVQLVRSVIGFLGIIAVIVIIWGGFKWMTAGGDSGKVDAAKKLIIQGIVGLVIILLAFAIAEFVISTLIQASA